MAAGGRCRALLAPLSALLSVELVLLLAAAAVSVNPFRGATYARWDSFNYLSIATRGYYLEEEGGRVVGGNAAWFPGYPLLIRTLKPMGLTPAKRGKLLSTAFAFGLLVLIGRLLPRQRPGGSRLPALLLAAFFPGFIYSHTVFPTAMVACLTLLALWLCARRRFLASGLLGALAASAYPTGCLVGAAMGLGILRDRELSLRHRLGALMQGPLLVGAGLIGVFAYQARTIGWDGFWRMRHDYFDNTPTDPFSSFVAGTHHVWHLEFVPELLPQAQTLLVAVVMTALGAWCWHRRRSLLPLEVLLFVNAVVFWLFPLAVGSYGATRCEALLIGIVPLLARLPSGLRAVLLAVFVALGTGLCLLFFQNQLV